MKSVRDRLVAFTVAVLVIQVGLIAAAPAALCRVGSASVADASTCTCDHVDGVECPMHRGAKRSPSGQRPGHQICAGCAEQAAAIAAALTTSAAIPQPSLRVAPPASTGVTLTAPTILIPDIDRRPTSPPPRS